MRGRHKKTGESSIESIVTEEPMPDDAVLPVEEFSVVEEPAATATVGRGSEGETVSQDDPLAPLKQEVEELKRRAAENLDKALWAQAELDNMRKRTARDIESAHKYALDRFVTELLPVMDSMEMGIAASTNVDDSASLKQGMELTLRMFIAALDKFGVMAIDPQGEKFNPERHEAVTLQQAEGVEPGMVISVMQKGYELNGRLVRPAMVIVSK
jgi:molecular chaperone GrpE